MSVLITLELSEFARSGLSDFIVYILNIFFSSVIILASQL